MYMCLDHFEGISFCSNKIRWHFYGEFLQWYMIPVWFPIFGVSHADILRGPSFEAAYMQSLVFMACDNSLHYRISRASLLPVDTWDVKDSAKIIRALHDLPANASLWVPVIRLYILGKQSNVNTSTVCVWLHWNQRGIIDWAYDVIAA